MTRVVPPSRKQLASLGWRSTSERPGHKTDGRWEHVDGWILVHCGHPTANWPYALYDAKGRMHLYGGMNNTPPIPTHGMAWASVRQAIEYVALRGDEGIAAMDQLEVTAPEDIRWRDAA